MCWASLVFALSSRGNDTYRTKLCQASSPGCSQAIRFRLRIVTVTVTLTLPACMRCSFVCLNQQALLRQLVPVKSKMATPSFMEALEMRHLCPTDPWADVEIHDPLLSSSSACWQVIPRAFHSLKFHQFMCNIIICKFIHCKLR